MKKISLLITAILLLTSTVNAQQISREELIFLTPEWKGERFPDGRPKVPDDLLNRMKLVTLEEAWAVLRSENFNYQYEDGWEMINPDSVLVGRALTATFVPGRPDIHRVLDKKGHEKDGRVKSQNSWPIDMLVKGDVYVVDQFGAHVDGPTIGDNLGNSIYTKSGNGIVYNGAIRDINGLKEIGSFTSLYRSYHRESHCNAGRCGVGKGRRSDIHSCPPCGTGGQDIRGRKAARHVWSSAPARTEIYSRTNRLTLV